MHRGRSDMSDSSQGPGWWMASDGKWYPPSAAPAQPPGGFVQGQGLGSQSGGSRWRRFRRLPVAAQVACWVVAAFVVLGAVGAATGSGHKPTRTKTIVATVPSTTATTAKPKSTTTAKTVPPTTAVPTTQAPMTTTVPPTTAPPTTQAPPVTQAPVITSPPVTAAPTASCYPLTNSGGCYEPGEYCRTSDHGKTGVAGDGEHIQCEDNNGWRWEPIP